MELKSDLLAIVQQLEDTPEGTAQFLSEILFFPEFQTFGDDAEAIGRAQLKLAQDIIAQLPGDSLARRGIPSDAQADTLVLNITAARRSKVWSEPVALELPIVTWNHGEFAKIAFVPALGIEVVASNPKQLPEMLESHVYFELRRRGIGRTLLHLAYISRATRLQLKRIKWTAKIKPPAERIKINAPKRERVLPAVGTRLRVTKRQLAYCREQEIEQLANLIGGRYPTCVLIVGESGVGKTAITLEAARRRGEFGLGARPFWRSSGSRIVAGQTGFGMWQERCTRIIDEAKETGSILCLGNLHELMQVGQSSCNSESIASFLRPAMVRADLLTFVECTPGQLAAIEARDPKILDPFRRLSLDAPQPEAARKILGQLNDEPPRSLPRLEPDALLKLDALHRRYMTYSAFPGRPARFLRGLRAESGGKQSITAADVTAAFGHETGLPAMMLEETAPFDHAAILRWFSGRVHAQDSAVELVVDRLSIVRAQLSRPRQPLASFLFTGPTGVGKTELAKTLAEFLYGSKDRLLRLDMSEYGSPASASRLVSSSFDESEGVLTSKVRDQPFSVILLDEFEKAHPSLFDLFLQVLGEGRLTDAAGRLADFSNSVIIMTSNLGAESYRKPELGFSSAGPGAQRDAYQHFLSVVKEQFRPEFFNRIDRVIPFAPLDHRAVRTIAEREISMAAARDGLAGKRIALELTDRCLDWIVAAGHDPRYGARPLKRAIEQRILLPVAEFLNRSPRPGGHISVDIEAGAQSAAITYGEDADAASGAGARRQLELAHTIDRASAVRRDYLRLVSSPLAAELESEKRRIERQKQAAYRKAWKKHKKGQPDPHVPFVPELELRLEFVGQLLARLEAESGAAARFEEKSLVDYYASSAAAPPELVARDAETPAPEPVSPEQFRSTLLDMFAANLNREDRATLTFISNDTRWIFDLADAYREVLAPRGVKFKAGVFRRKRHDKEFVDSDTGVLIPMPLVEADYHACFADADPDIGALVVQFRGGRSGLLLADERGLHQRLQPEIGKWDCLVQATAEPLEDVRIPMVELERIKTRDLPVRRLFDDQKRQWKDRHLQESGHERCKGRGTFAAEVIESILDDALIAKARAALGG